ncbi:DUF6184 family natural product biosynthesis lipoprotein [Cystobacter ferrugineus]|uniref:Uncharacterized protein n=1 Tax=Cystobacter ferrugineus TaxID=83449 RepID=A0A1L9B378_9BACT|nr:DUF6184 family natural product biosynthesis lipoprotein [Cystobacter ferrugineus]OJH36717.1 hypothetical protein BON30_33410 [Cystobacter ferrugineus]
MVVGVSGLFGCGTIAGITDKQADAVNAVVGSTCDRYQDCGEIGPDKKYASREACDSAERDTWNSRWPAADCDNRINGDQLNECLDAIADTSCTNVFDQINTALNKCPKSEVCSGD